MAVQAIVFKEMRCCITTSPDLPSCPKETSVITSNPANKGKHHLQNLPCSTDQVVCASCGGNGYTKTTPSRYQTCLKCLGRGFISFDNEK